jgi:hypothetical protein
MADNACTKTCEYCDKRGVPLIPLRYGVARAGGRSPKAEGPTVPLPNDAAHYTRRLLRSGYLYVYDEVRKLWEEYFVTPDGYFFRLMSTPGVPPVLPAKPFDCPDVSHAALASCITIPLTPGRKADTVVWLSFSDVQWTADVRARHETFAYRKKHMRCVTVNDFAKSTDATHCLPIKSLAGAAPEYSFSAQDLKKEFAFNPLPSNERAARFARLESDCNRLAPNKAFSVVLDDPVGVAIELDALMVYNLNQHLANPAWARELAVSNAIVQIEEGVRSQAVALEESAAESLASQQMSANPLGHMLSENTRKQTEALGTVTPAEAKRAADNAWKKYAAKFDETKAKQWRADFDKSLKSFDDKFVAPLAVAHAAWMKSACMRASFECNYDEKNPHSGLVYSRSLGVCIGSTQDKAACFDLYEDWLNGTIDDKTNLLLRALVLNLDDAEKKVKEALKVSLDWRGFPLDGVVGSFGGATEQLADGKSPVLGRLIQAVAGPIVKLLAKGADGVVRPGLVALAMHSGGTWAVVEVTGTMKQFRAQLVRELIRASGQPLSKHQVDRAVQQQLKRLKAAGVNLDSKGVSRFLVVVDRQASAVVPTGLPSAQRADLLSKAITTPEDVEKLTMHHWREQIARPFAKGSIPFVSGLLGGLLQYVAMQKLGEDKTKAMSHEAQEATWRLRAGTTALVGTITELSGLALEKMGVKTVLKMGKGLEVLATDGIKVIGKGLGIAGAVVMAGFDIYQGISNWREGNRGVGVLYGISGMAGLAAAVFLAAGATGVGLVLVLILVAVGFLIESMKDNKVQDWLERCIWGTALSNRYQNSFDEMAELKSALAG